jgi:anti-sigma regulatory factor (Ser/Thr protein kinase)
MPSAPYIEDESRVDSRIAGRRSPDLTRLLGRTFSADRQAPGAARHALECLEGSLDEALAADVRLLVSELVTNSLRHTGTTEIQLEVWWSDQLVRVAVSDQGAGFDLRGRPQPGEASGWGLFMVDRLADRWGVAKNGRTCVWFELTRPEAGGRQRRDFFEHRPDFA